MQKKEILKSLLREFHNSPIPEHIKRDIEIPLSSGKIISLVGPRRSGKTFFLYQLMAQLLQAKFPKEYLVYLNFEDDRLNLNLSDLDLILQAYRELYPEIELSRCFFFFDEIQNIEGWEKFIRRLYETQSRNIFITGSNAKLLGEEIATALRGRTIKFEIWPLSFKEFLKFKKAKLKWPQDLYDSRVKARLLNLFNEYMLWGGFPEIVFQPVNLKIMILQEYFDVMIYRDLIERYAIKDTFILRYFIKRLAENVTKPLSINKIYNEIKSQGLKVGKNLLYEFLEYLEKAFLVRKITKRVASILKSEFTEKKVYFVDNGILRAVKVFEGEDYGILLENLIFRELFRRNKRLYFYKENRECDFILGDQVAIQVAFKLTKEEVWRREIEGVLACCKRFNLKEAFIVTFDEEEVIKYNNFTIHVLPAYQFLLKLDFENFLGD